MSQSSAAFARRASIRHGSPQAGVPLGGDTWRYFRDLTGSRTFGPLQTVRASDDLAALTVRRKPPDRGIGHSQHICWRDDGK